MCRLPIARRPPAWTRGGRGGRYWRSRLVVRSDAGDDPEELRDVGGDLPGGDHWPTARVAAALASAGHLGGVGRRDRAGDDWQRRLQAHNETFAFLADIGFRADQEHKSPPSTPPGGLFGAGYWGSSSRTLAAWAPFGPCSMSNSTAWPSASER